MFKKNIKTMFTSIDEEIINKSQGFDTILYEIDEESVNMGENNFRKMEQSNRSDIVIETMINNEKYEIKKYRDFDTIDWLQENIQSKINSHKIKKELKENINIYKTLRYIFEKCSGWIVIFSIGILSGLLFPFILVGGEWLLDLRQGYCSTEISNNYYDCCRLINRNYSYSEICTNWITWGEALKIENYYLLYFLNYVIYVSMSVIYAWSSAKITYILAPYACGSGITEIKIILSGFVIKGFLGIRTVVVKVLAVLLSIGSGLNVSHEGVMIHFSSSIANLFSRPIKKFNSNESKRREVNYIYLKFNN